MKYCFMVCLAIPGFQQLNRELKQTYGDLFMQSFYSGN